MITQERLKELLSYDPETGVFVWRQDRVNATGGGRIKAGTVAGGRNHGYVRMRLDCRRYEAHRLAWLYVYGKWPDGDIDHKDLNRANNAIANLREATRRQNVVNSRSRSTNKLGVKGVSFCNHHQRYRAAIRRNGKQVSLGYFKDVNEAHAAYCAAAASEHGEFARFK